MNPIIKRVLELLLNNQDLFSTGICDWVESLEKNKLITKLKYYGWMII
jgi:hypothetical protein